MVFILSLICHLVGFSLLSILSYIDLKTRLLPNVYVFAFALTGIAFHTFTLCAWLSPVNIIAGAAIGGGLLYLVRAGANMYYGQDALGLGDVKLIAAAGLWLGVDGILFAITLGALAGLIHGLGYGLMIAFQTKSPLNLKRLAIPAGPGFAIGIIAVALWHYADFYAEVLNNVSS